MNVCILGKKGSGKTTVANMLAVNKNKNIVRFARRLKEIITKCSGLTDNDKINTQYYKGRIDLNYLNKELAYYNYHHLTSSEIDNIKSIEYYTIDKVYRFLLQEIGTGIFRKRNEDHWLQFMNDDIFSSNNNFICDDCRFVNEYDFLKNFGKCLFVRIINVYENDNEDDQHRSENELNGAKVDIMIYNNMTSLEELSKEVNKIKI